MWDSGAVTSFTDQVRRLCEQGYPQLAGIGEDLFSRQLLSFKEEVQRVRGNTGGGVPIVVVIPNRFVPLRLQLEAMPFNSTTGACARIPPAVLVDMIATPHVPYLILDVEPGLDTLNMAPDDAAQLIHAEQRRPLVTAEILSLAMQYPWVLNHHCLYAVGSRHRQTDRIALLSARGGRPQLSVGWGSSPECGSPSCSGTVIRLWRAAM